MSRVRNRERDTEIRVLSASGWTNVAIAKKYGIHHTRVGQILNPDWKEIRKEIQDKYLQNLRDKNPYYGKRRCSGCRQPGHYRKTCKNDNLNSIHP